MSTTQSVISEDYTSAIEADSSDLEFYDLSEDENSEKTATPLDIVRIKYVNVTSGLSSNHVFVLLWSS